MKSMATVTFKKPTFKKAFEQPDEWVGLFNKKITIVDNDKVNIRFSKVMHKRTGTYKLALQLTIGKDIIEVMELKAGDKLLFHRSIIRPNLIKISKPANFDSNAYKLGTSANAPYKFYIRITLDDLNFIHDKSVEAEHDISEDGLIIDLSELMK